MTVQEALRAALREHVGPAARDHGFRGTAPTWRRCSPSGDWAVVNVQSSPWSTSESVRCVINLALAPAPWLDWMKESLGAGYPKSVGESLGLYRTRLHPTGAPAGADVWWEIDSAAQADAAATDMRHQLDRKGWPCLMRLLEEGAMLEQVRSGDLGLMKRASLGVFFSRAEALLVADDGPGPELDRLLAEAYANTMDTQRDHARRFETWVRQRATTGLSRPPVAADAVEDAWDVAIARSRTLDVPAARLNLALLDALRPRWAGAVRPDTSMLTLLFTRPGETGYAFSERVEVQWETEGRVRLALVRDVPRRGLERPGGRVTVAGDFTRPENALPAVEALLLQLATPDEG